MMQPAEFSCTPVWFSTFFMVQVLFLSALKKAQLKIKKSLFTSLSSFPSLYHFFFPEKITVKLFSILIYLLKIKSALCKKWLSLYHFLL